MRRSGMKTILIEEGRRTSCPLSREARQGQVCHTTLLKLTRLERLLVLEAIGIEETCLQTQKVQLSLIELGDEW